MTPSVSISTVTYLDNMNTDTYKAVRKLLNEYDFGDVRFNEDGWITGLGAFGTYDQAGLYIFVNMLNDIVKKHLGESLIKHIPGMEYAYWPDGDACHIEDLYEYRTFKSDDYTRVVISSEIELYNEAKN